VRCDYIRIVMLPSPDEIRSTPIRPRILVTEIHVAAHLSDVWQQIKKRFIEMADTKVSDCKNPTDTASSHSRS
jgi:hypothetical protein